MSDEWTTSSGASYCTDPAEAIKKFIEACKTQRPIPPEPRWVTAAECERMIDEYKSQFPYAKMRGVQQQEDVPERRSARVRSMRDGRPRFPVKSYDLDWKEKWLSPDWYYRKYQDRGWWVSEPRFKKHRPKKKFRGLFFYVAPRHRPAKSSKM